MSKMKTVKALAARFRVTSKGRLKRQRMGKRHLLSDKAPKRKRQLSRAAYVDRAHEKVYTILIGA